MHSSASLVLCFVVIGFVSAHILGHTLAEILYPRYTPRDPRHRLQRHFQQAVGKQNQSEVKQTSEKMQPTFQKSVVSVVSRRGVVIGGRQVMCECVCVC